MNSPAKWVWLFALASSVGCGVNFRQLGASSGDYADYRAFRTATTIGGRLRAASSYLQCRPDGAFRDEVAVWFERAEPLFFEATSGSASGMQAYLDALPSGPHAESAAQRRESFNAAARADAGERLSARGAEIERRLAAAAQSREDVTTAYATWVGRLLDFDAWGHPIDDAKGGFAPAWGGDPRPKCAKDRCTKLYELPYELEVRGKPEPFLGILEVSFRLAKGRVAEAAVTGPDLFARLTEAHQAEPIPETEEGRARAVKYVIQLTAGAIERRLEAARCGRDATPPAVMLRECDGLRVEVVPKSAAGGEDRVVFRRPGGL